MFQLILLKTPLNPINFETLNPIKPSSSQSLTVKKLRITISLRKPNSTRFLVPQKFFMRQNLVNFLMKLHLPLSELIREPELQNPLYSSLFSNKLLLTLKNVPIHFLIPNRNSRLEFLQILNNRLLSHPALLNQRMEIPMEHPTIQTPKGPDDL